MDLLEEVINVCGQNSRVVIVDLQKKGLLDRTLVRNFLIRKDFNDALKKEDTDLIKHIFIDISDKYNISIRQVQRIVYDYMKTKCQQMSTLI